MYKVIVGLILAFFVYLIVTINKQHTEGYEKCKAANGVWIDRSLMCIEGKEIKL